MATYTKVSKPTGTGYTRVNIGGKTEYDQADLTFDDSNTFYDGIDQAAYTLIAKPTGGFEAVIKPGMTLGLLIPLTYTRKTTISSDDWTDINKPT